MGQEGAAKHITSTAEPAILQKEGGNVGISSGLELVTSVTGASCITYRLQFQGHSDDVKQKGPCCFQFQGFLGRISSGYVPHTIVALIVGGWAAATRAHCDCIL